MLPFMIQKISIAYFTFLSNANAQLEWHLTIAIFSPCFLHIVLGHSTPQPLSKDDCLSEKSWLSQTTGNGTSHGACPPYVLLYCPSSLKGQERRTTVIVYGQIILHHSSRGMSWGKWIFKNLTWKLLAVPLHHLFCGTDKRCFLAYKEGNEETFKTCSVPLEIGLWVCMLRELSLSQSLTNKRGC